jgi:hypothetical protein
MRSAASEGPYVIEFIERHCRITKGKTAGQLVKLVEWQRDLVTDLFALSDGSRRYRRGYVQMPRKNGKTFLLACVALYEAVFGELGGRSTSSPVIGCRRPERSGRSARSSRPTPNSGACSRSTSTQPRSPPPAPC